MKDNREGKIKNKKIAIALMEYVVTLGCLLIAFVMFVNKDRIKQVNSYAKPEDVIEYRIEEGYMTRIRPLTEYETFKEIVGNTLKGKYGEECEVKVYVDKEKTEEVETGRIKSGMVVESKNGEEVKDYTISVVGDINADGRCSVADLEILLDQRIGVREITEEVEKYSADISLDGRITIADVECCINYILTREMPDDKKNPEKPEIVVEGEENKETDWYRSDVEVEIIEKARDEEEIEKTVTTIEKYEEESKVVEKETTQEKEITITEEGRYIIKAQSYGTNGLKSEVSEKEINIDKTAPELNISRKDIDKTQCRIEIQASDNRWIAKYSVTREGEEERSKEGIDEKEIKGYVTIRENGKYKVTVEDKAGNKKEKEIEITGLNNRYTVVFKNEDESIITKKDYAEGEIIKASEVPQNPSKAEDNTYTYEFAGWKTTNDQGEEVTVTSEQIAGETVKGNKEYKAEYTELFKNYTVTFKDEDGRVIATKNNYHYNEKITIPENPSKAEDNTYTYEFKGWTPEIELGTEEEQQELRVTGNIEYTATYEAKYKEYIVTFKQDTGEILSNLGHHYGDKVKLPEDPHKLSTMEYAYTFTGWNMVNEQGQGVSVTKEEIQNTDVTKELEFVATYESTKINYNLVFYNNDYNEETGEGTLIERKTYNYGDIITFPEAIKEDTEEIKYIFDSWENLGTEEKSSTEINITFRAKYREEYYVARLEEVTEWDAEIWDMQTGEIAIINKVVQEGKSYLTLKEAIEAAEGTPRTIRMLKDTEESVLIDDEQNITLNLNGKTITAKRTYVIKNYGELTIVNNSENEGKILEISEESIGYGIYNRDGKVTVQSGTIAAETSKVNGATYAIYNQSENPVEVTGGSVIADAKGENSVSSGIYNLAGKEIVVTGGLVLGNAIGAGSTTYGIYNETEGKVEVTGGIIEGKASLSSATSYGIYNKVSQDVIISGNGKVIAQSDKNKAYGIYNEEGKTEISGGEIEVTAYVGYGVYNDKGIIESTSGKTSIISSISYGIYNNEGNINYDGGTIDLLGTTAYGIYNRNNLNITGGKINNKTNGMYTYAIYNESEEEISISNMIILGTERGIYNIKGNVIISGVDITATEGIYAGGTSKKIIVESGTITATRNGINNNVGTVILKDAVINSNSYGVFTTYSGNTEIGIKDNTINLEKPYIYGKTYAVYMDLNQEGNIRFYDGILQGQNAIFGGISDIEENTEIEIQIIDNNGKDEERATLKEIPAIYVARIGETGYTTLARAIEAVPENQGEITTIEILEDFDNSIATEVPNNKKVKIDLKGHTLTTQAKGGLINKGTLEIIDTKEYEETEEKTGKILSTIGIAVSNEGIITLTNGIIESNYYGIYNNNNGKVTINEGSIIADNTGIYNKSAKVVVNDGSINSKVGIYGLNNSDIKIEGGKIEAETSGCEVKYSTLNVNGGSIFSNDNGILSYSSTMNITNGNITGKNYGIRNNTTTSNINILGGNITGASGIYDSYGSSYIKISNGNVYGNNGYGIYTYEGTTEVLGGKITATSDGIMNGTTVIIGTKDQNVDNNMPIIISNTYGISSSNIKYYDGKIYGKKEAIYGNITDIELGYDININTENINEEEYIVVNLENEKVFEEPIAQIGEVTFNKVSDLRNAISSIPINMEQPTEITILNNFNTAQLIQIKENQNVIINLNGKTIDAYIINNGNLEIIDKIETHQGKLKNSLGNVIRNEYNATTKVISGTIEGTQYGIYMSRPGNVILGTKDGEVDNNLLTIKGENRGIEKWSSSCNLEMYDGKVIGKSGSSINIVEEGYKTYTYKEAEYYITELQPEDPVASTGGIDYYSLQEAFNNCENGNEVTVLRDINLKNTVSVPGEKEVILDLKGYTITSSNDITLINNGTLSISNSDGSIQNIANEKTVVQNNGILNLNRGTINNYGNSSYNSGTAVENNGTFNLCGGIISGYTYGIKNKENSMLSISSGNIYSSYYAIYNESIKSINISGGNIEVRGNQLYSTISYGIYNNANASINIDSGNIKVYSYTTDGYSYGIYNNSDGSIHIKGANTKIISGNNRAYGHGIYNNGNGNVTIEDGTISTENCSNLAYGIKNVNSGKVEVTGGSIISSSTKGLSYGIENGISGKVEMTGGTITSKTEEGTAYGINNMSVQMLKIKQGTIKTEGVQSYGIYSNIAELTIGENDEEVKNDNPLIEAGNIGIYVHSVDTKFGFYDGKIIGKQAINVDVNIPEGYKLFRYTEENTDKETAILIERDAHIATFWNEDRTRVIAKVPFKVTDNEIQEPTPPEIEGYVGLWTDYEIKDEDIEIQLYYVIKRNNGEKLTATDEKGLIWNYTYQDGKATDVYYGGNQDQLEERVEIPSRLDGYPVENLHNSVGYSRNIFADSNNAQNNTVKTVIIPKSVRNIGSYAFFNCSSLTNIEIPDSVISIGKVAFYKCSSLTSIIIPDGVTSIEDYEFSACASLKKIDISNVTSIGDYAFSDCSGLTSIEMKNVRNIGRSAFSKCSSLTEINIPNVTEIKYNAFLECSSLLKILIPLTFNYNNSNIFYGLNNSIELTVTGNGEMNDYYVPWRNLHNIKKVNLNYGIKNIGTNAFENCSSLAEIEIPESVVSIGNYAFKNCSSLTEIEIPESVTSIGSYAFSGCGNLNEIIISEGIKSIGDYTFNNCTNLADIYINNLENNITFGANWSGNAYAHFNNCKHTVTKVITKKGLNIQDVEGIIEDDKIECDSTYKFKIEDEQGNMVTNEMVRVVFQGLFTNSGDMIKEITPDEDGVYTIENINRNITIKIGKDNGTQWQATDKNGITWNYTYQDGEAINVYYESGELGEIVEIPDELDKYPVVHLRNETGRYITSRNMFVKQNYHENTTIRQVKIPDSVTSIGEDAFWGCISLEKIEMPNVTSIGYSAFKGCINLEEIEMPNVTSIGYGVFSGCISLEKIEMPNLASIAGGAFSGCSNLIRIETSIDNEYFYSENGILFNKEKTILIKYPEGKEERTYNIPESVTSIGESAFSGCTGLTSIEISNVTSIGSYAFYGCTGLTSIEMPNVTSIEYSAFYGCENIEKIEMPNVTCIKQRAFSKCNGLIRIKMLSVTNIESYAFFECWRLTTIKMPNVISIGSNAFEGCMDLKKIELPNVTRIGYETFKYCSGLTDIYFGNEENNITFGEDWKGNNNFAYVHFSDCTHAITIDKEIENIHIEEVSNNLIDGKIKCGETYQFKLVDNEGNVVENPPMKIISQGEFTNSEDVIEEIIPDEDGIYSIEKIKRNKTIKIGKDNGEQGQAQDKNGIIWNYTYQDGNAINVYYESGELGNIVDIPSELDRCTVTNLYNNKIDGNGNIFATDYWQENRTIERVNIPNTVTYINNNAFYSCNNLSDIYVDNEQSNLQDSSWQISTNAFVHYKSCKHQVSFNLESENIKLIEETTQNEIQNVDVNCEDSLRFRLLDTTDNSIIYNKKLYINSQGRFRYSDYIVEGLEPNEEGIYTIENINRNKTVIEHVSNGTKLTAKDSNNITWEFTYQDGNAEDVHYYDGDLGENVEIPSKLFGYPVVSLRNPSRNGGENGNILTKESWGSNQTVKTVIVPESVTTVGSWSFYNCVNIKTIHFPINVTKIGGNVFRGCISLTDIYIDNLEKNIEKSDDLNEYGYVHYGNCKHDITFEKYTIEDIYLQTIEEHGEDGHIKCNENYKFKLVDSNGNPVTTEKVLVRFAGLENEIDEDARDYYDRVRSSLDNSSNMFASEEEGIRELQAGENGIYTVEKVHRNITIIVGSYQTADENNITWNYSIEDGKAINVYYAGGDLRETVEIPTQLDGHEVISLYNKEESGNIFAKADDTTKVKNVIIQNGVSKIGKYAFYKLGSLEKITIPDSVTEIGYASFYKCENLSNISIPIGVTKIGGWAFSNCSSLKNIVTPDSVIEIGKAAFSSCISLESIKLPADLEVIEDNLLINCEKLKNIQIPVGLKSIGNRAFYNCGSIESMTLPDTVTILKEYAFYNCSNMKNIKLSNSITSLENYLFSGCRNLEKIEIPENVTEIKNDVFSSCSSLINIEIPSSVTKIGIAFSGCTKLENIYINNLESNVAINRDYGNPWIPWYGEVKAKLHYRDCTHSINITNYTTDIIVETLTENIDINQIPCRGNYQFRLIKDNEVIKNKILKMTELGDREYYNVEKELEPDEYGIYTINNINRDIVITLGEKYRQATDENGII